MSIMRSGAQCCAANPATLTKRMNCKKGYPHSRIFRERDISPILPVRPGYVELPVAPIAPSLARSHVSRALAS